MSPSGERQRGDKTEAEGNGPALEKEIEHRQLSKMAVTLAACIPEITPFS